MATEWYSLLYDPGTKEITYAPLITSGQQGPTGPVGSQGVIGLQGQLGVQGLNGVDGPQGVQGVDGVQGPEGTASSNAHGFFGSLMVNGDLTQSAGTVNMESLNVMWGSSGGASITSTVVTRTGTWTDATGYPLNAWEGIAFGKNATGHDVWVAVASTGSGDRVMTSMDGVDWTFHPTPIDLPWTDVAYANGLFVAVADSGLDPVMYSHDGVNWTQGTAPEGSYKSLVFGTTNTGVGVWTAVGTSGANMYSYDGMDWMTNPGYTYNGNFTCVTYGNGIYVAVNTTQNMERVMTTRDPTSFWTYQQTGTSADNAWESVAFGNGLFCAVASSGAPSSCIMTSPDGRTWTVVTSMVSNCTWSTIVFADGLFVALATNSTRMMASTNGVAWTWLTDPFQSVWSSVAYGNNTLVAVARSGTSLVAYAPTYALTSSILQASTNASYNPVLTLGTNNASTTTVNGIFNVSRQTPSITWTARTSAATNVWNSITYGNGVYCAVASSGTNRVMVSNNGSTWSLSTSGVLSTVNWSAVAYGDTIDYGPTLVAVGNAGSSSTRVMSSSSALPTTLGRVWQVSPVQPGSSNNFNAIAYGNQYFVAVGPSVTAYSNSGGTNWTVVTPPNTNVWTSVAFATLSDGTDIFVAVSSSGIGNRVMRSTDYGTSWTSHTSAADLTWRSVAFGNGLFVAVSSDGSGSQVMTSPDGIAWTLRSTPVANEWMCVTYSPGNGGLWVALARTGTNNRCMTSVDGITWTARSTTNVNNDWLSVVYSPQDRQLVAVAYNTLNIAGGQVMTSPGIVVSNLMVCDVVNNYVSASNVLVSGLGFAPACRTNLVKIDYGRYTSTGDTGTIGFGFTFTNPPSVTFGCDQSVAGTMYSVQITTLTTTSFSFQRMSFNGTTLSLTGSSFSWTAIGV